MPIEYLFDFVISITALAFAVFFMVPVTILYSRSRDAMAIRLTRPDIALAILIIQIGDLAVAAVNDLVVSLGHSFPCIVFFLGTQGAQILFIVLMFTRATHLVVRYVPDLRV